MKCFNRPVAKSALLACVLPLMLVACSSQRARPKVTTGSGGAHYKVGDPYQIKGIWYYPKEDYSYDETGIASWYGADFHDQKTANGEIFNKNELTAAHATLPMPSLARVTNLENGRSLVVRINDRGPFSGARLIDVSQRAAQLLGFEQQGTAKVRVQVLADESKAIADAMRRYGSPAPETVKVASALPAAPAPSTAVTSRPLEPVAGQRVSESPLTAPSASPAALAPPVQSDVPLPTNRAEAAAMMQVIQPVPEVRQLPVTGPSQIYIQAGAFTKQDNAVRLKQKLARLGHVSVAPAAVRGVQYYRVRIGPIVDVTTADKMLRKVMQAGAGSARIVVD